MFTKFYTEFIIIIIHKYKIILLWYEKKKLRKKITWSMSKINQKIMCKRTNFIALLNTVFFWFFFIKIKRCFYLKTFCFFELNNFFYIYFEQDRKSKMDHTFVRPSKDLNENVFFLSQILLNFWIIIFSIKFNR